MSQSAPVVLEHVEWELPTAIPEKVVRSAASGDYTPSRCGCAWPRSLDNHAALPHRNLYLTQSSNDLLGRVCAACV